MSKPRLLDLFCGAGGAAMGYSRAGFDVVGVDINPQPHYPFEFVQADAIEYLSETLGRGFDAIHASPPCQAYSIMRHLPWLVGNEYWASVPPTRAALQATDRPWVLENVKGAPVDGITLCGQMFGLRSADKPVYRHRLFESSVFMLAPGHPKHHEVVHAGHRTMYLRDDSFATDVSWMTKLERRQAIPPAYTEWIGAQLLASLRAAA